MPNNEENVVDPRDEELNIEASHKDYKSIPTAKASKSVKQGSQIKQQSWLQKRPYKDLI